MILRDPDKTLKVTDRAVIAKVAEKLVPINVQNSVPSRRKFFWTTLKGRLRIYFITYAAKRRA
jgi:hypothetical protein